MTTYRTEDRDYVAESVGEWDAVRIGNRRVYAILGSVDPKKHDVMEMPFGDGFLVSVDGFDFSLDFLEMYMDKEMKIGSYMVCALVDESKEEVVRGKSEDLRLTSKLKEIRD